MAKTGAICVTIEADQTSFQAVQRMEWEGYKHMDEDQERMAIFESNRPQWGTDGRVYNSNDEEQCQPDPLECLKDDRQLRRR